MGAAGGAGAAKDYGASVAEDLLSRGFELDVDGLRELMEGCDVLGLIAVNVLRNEGHDDVDVEGAARLFSQEFFSTALDCGRAAVAGVIA